MKNEWQTYTVVGPGYIRLGIALYTPEGDCLANLEDTETYKADQEEEMRASTALNTTICATLNAKLER